MDKFDMISGGFLYLFHPNRLVSQRGMFPQHGLTTLECGVFFCEIFKFT